MELLLPDTKLYEKPNNDESCKNEIRVKLLSKDDIECFKIFKNR